MIIEISWSLLDSDDMRTASNTNYNDSLFESFTWLVFQLLIIISDNASPTKGGISCNVSRKGWYKGKKSFNVNL